MKDFLITLESPKGIAPEGAGDGSRNALMPKIEHMKVYISSWASDCFEMRGALSN